MMDQLAMSTNALQPTTHPSPPRHHQPTCHELHLGLLAMHQHDSRGRHLLHKLKDTASIRMGAEAQIAHLEGGGAQELRGSPGAVRRAGGVLHLHRKCLVP